MFSSCCAEPATPTWWRDCLRVPLSPSTGRNLPPRWLLHTMLPSLWILNPNWYLFYSLSNLTSIITPVSPFTTASVACCTWCKHEDQGQEWKVWIPSTTITPHSLNHPSLSEGLQLICLGVKKNWRWESRIASRSNLRGIATQNRRTPSARQAIRVLIGQSLWPSKNMLKENPDERMLKKEPPMLWRNAS